MKRSLKKYLNSLTFRFLILCMLAIIVPTMMLGGLTNWYSTKWMTQEINASIRSTAQFLVYNLDQYISELERLTLAPYNNIELLQSIRKIEKNNRALHKNDNYIIFNKLDYVLPKTFIYAEDEIMGLMIMVGEKTQLVAKKYGAIEVNNNLDQKLIEAYQRRIKSKEILYHGEHTVSYYTGEEKNIFSVSRILKDYNTGEILGIIKADADAGYIDDMIKEIGFSDETLIVITDKEGDVIYPAEMIKSDKSKLTDDYIHIKEHFPRANWQVHILLSKHEMNNRLKILQNFTIYITIICLLIAIGFYVIGIQKVIRPLKEIFKGIEAIQNGNFEYPIEVNTKFIEIRLFQKAIKKMQSELKKHINQEYRAVIERKNAEYAALQARINPHFLYNTLSGFITLNRMGERDLLEKGIFSLTGMMRYIFESDSSRTIEEEVHFIRQYLELCHMRFDERLSYEIIGYESVADYKIPKLILQPIVENSIIHGLEPSSKVCHITIKFVKIENPFKDNKHYISISLSDDGVGFDYRANPLKQNEGLYNIKERIGLAYEHSIFHIESFVGVGTNIVIILPYEEGV